MKYSFHTTQYDLNQVAQKVIAQKGGRFHTTQYDLNPLPIFFFFKIPEQFPYYIVRFKPGRIFGIILFFGVFPYYIVRFKLRSSFAFCNCLTPSFHTTQYDLNDECVYVSRKFFFRFHTTQYDLNHSQVFPVVCPSIMFPYYIVRFKQE